MQKLYKELATWWPLISPVEDYEDEAAFFAQLMKEAGLPPNPALLELGSGGGSNAFHLKPIFAKVTLTDLSPEMLAVSRDLNPDCEHLEGDMRTLRLGRTFDVVFVHDAIEYMPTPQELQQAIATAFVHCKPGGLAMFVPDQVKETFESSTEHEGRDSDGRAFRSLEWSYDPDVNDTTYTVDYVFVLREGNKPVQVEHDHHVCGLFPRADWLRFLEEAGFEKIQIVRDHYKRDIFVAYHP